MNRFAKTILFILLLSVMPARIWAQDYVSNSNLTQQAQIRDYENGFLFNVFGIANVEERVQLASALATSDIWLCNPTDNPGELYIRPNNYHTDIPIHAEFDYLRMMLREEYEEASTLSKEEFSEVFNSWAHNISHEYYNFLIADHLDRANHCMDAEPFCTSDVYNFPALNSGYSWSGPNYGCLGSSPTNKHSFWYYMRIGVAGNITIKIEASFDVDFALWGPFDNQTDPCPVQQGQAGMLTADCDVCPNNTSSSSHYPYGNLHDCSYDARHFEFANVVNGEVGQYFILLITNFSGTDGNITFQKYSGDGETDCGIMPGIANNDGPYCEGETIHLTVNQQPNATYAWTGPDGWTSTEPNPIRENCTLDMAGTYTIITTVGAQTTPATTEVSIYQQPTPSFTATAVCQGEATIFEGLATGANVANYDWDFGDDSPAGSGQNVSHTYAEDGTYEVTLTVTAEDGTCPGEITLPVTVNSQPVANAGPDLAIDYPGLTTQLSGSGGSDAFSYHWEPANMVVNPDSPNTETAVIRDTQCFYLTVTNPQGGCTSTDTVCVYVGTAPISVEALAIPNVICEGESTQLQVIAGGGSGDFSYSWMGSDSFTSDVPNPVVSPTQTTTYTCTVTDNITLEPRSKTVTVTVNHHHLNGSKTINQNSPEFQCDSIQFTWFTDTLWFKENGRYSFPNDFTVAGETVDGCDTAMVVTVMDMKYAPNPTRIRCLDEGAVVYGIDHDSIAVVTNTEFFSFQYTFRIEETYEECIWDDSCHWSISKPSWAIEYDTIPKLANGKYYSECTVYVAEHDDKVVVLTATPKNGCGSKDRYFYLKPSFLGMDENSNAAAKVSIVPNPNNGQMHINFEDMEGLTVVKVLDMTGNTIDSFETNVGADRYSYDYTMKRHAEGIYFFVFANNNRVFAKKVVIIQ